MQDLEYAEDVALLDVDHVAATDHMVCLVSCSQPAGMAINTNKTKTYVETVMPLPQTTEQEVIALQLPHARSRCGRTIPTKQGTLIHKARWCASEHSERSTKGTLADIYVQRKKREDIAAVKPPVVLGSDAVENVHMFMYLGSVMWGGGSTVEDTERHIQLATTKFSALLHMYPTTSCLDLSICG